MKSVLIAQASALSRRPPFIGALDDMAVVAGFSLLIVAARDLLLSYNAAPPLGLIALIVLALSVHAYPLVRSLRLNGRANALSMTAATPLLAILALYGASWAIVVAAAALGLDSLARYRQRIGVEAWLRGVARAALTMGLAGWAFVAMRGAGPQMSIDLTLPALAAAELVLTLTSWLFAAPAHAVETDTPYRQLASESLLGALPALAAEPVLAFILAEAAGTPRPATLLAAVLPLAALIVVLRLHTDMRSRLARAHVALGRAHEQLRIQATTDPLTGLANRRLFEELLTARLEEASRYGRPLAVLLLDLDGFKRINDTHGHAAGDAVLVAVAGALRRSLRRSDLPARLAGDEFVALLPETNGAHALTLAERVCKEIGKLNVTVGDVAISPSASVGAASTDGQPGLDPAGLLAAADGAAYTAKSAGKNAARLASSRVARRLPPRQRARVAP